MMQVNEQKHIQDHVPEDESQGVDRMTLVEVIDVTKEFRKGDEVIKPLDRANMTMAPHDFISLMGPSGSGKSTLLNQIAGIDRPTEGKIIVNGAEVTRMSRRQLARWRTTNIGYVFQTSNLIPVLTAFENVEMPLLLLPFTRAERRNRVMVALEAVGLTDRIDHYPRQLSGGQEQRVGIARAIVTDPLLVVADEPTGNLDSASTAQILDLLRRLNEELGTTLLMVTHDEEAGVAARRRLYLHDGKLIKHEGTSKNFVFE
jgi:putative ABC transport system ATP-binding protein